MLVDLTPKPVSDRMVLTVFGDAPVRRLDKGIFQLNCWNPEFFFVEKLSDAAEEPKPRYPTAYERLLPQCDRDTIFERDIRAWYQQCDRHRRAMNRLYSQKYRRNWPGWSDYGVCDEPSQVLARYPHIVDDDVPRAITVVEIRREDQPSTGGWRYHKWGSYIGRQRPRAEYLHDDEHIDAVWTYHVYRVEQPC